MVENIVALFGTQIAAYIFPLATVPYLARVLGPSHWGIVAFAQALGLYLSMVVDFGFQLSASRRIARIRDDHSQVAKVVAGVLGAKAILAIVCIVAVLILQYFSRSFQQDDFILWGGALSGIAQGFSMLWFYQGMEKMKKSAAIEVAGKALVCLGIFVFVRKPMDAWKVLALQSFCFAGVAVLQSRMTYSEIVFQWPTPDATWQAIRDSAVMFMFRSSVSLYTTANALILGAITTPLAVGFYSGSERIVKALLSLITPVSQSLYPRISRFVVTDPDKAVSLTRISLLVMTAGSALLSICAAVAAPLIVRLLLGKGYEQAVPVLRVLALLMPPAAASTVLGIQWMLPLGMEGAYNAIVMSAGVLNVTLALWWASRWQQVGMAWAVVVSEYVVTVAIWIVLVRTRKNPFNKGAQVAAQLQNELAIAR